jgi:DnaJ family protein C protein 17
MREEAARAMEEVRLREISERRKEKVEKTGLETGADLNNGNEEGDGPLDYTLLLQFPPFPLIEDATLPDFLTGSETFQTKISTLYGSLENVVFSPQAGPSSVKPKKPKKVKGAKAIVEFKKSNRDGCWACWKDHQDGGPGPGRLGVQGVKVGFAGRGEGEVPSWFTRLEGTTSTRSTSARTTCIPGDLGRVPTSFPTAATSFPSCSRADPNQDKEKKGEEGKRKEGEDFESGILFRMRRMERERMEAEIRREEEEEEVAGQ